MSHLKIYRASAGSGKTYTLTGEYINLLFSQKNNYSKILAVTFTNKATAEMRTRILENLYELSNSSIKNPDFLRDLMKNHKMTEHQVRSEAAAILRQLLHDYSRFSVSTIDSFFQQIVRSFAKEMGLPMGFRLELQPNQIMTQAIDQVILEMDQKDKADLKKWLIEFAETKMEQDRGWNITREIKQISEAIYSEVFQENAALLQNQLSNKEELFRYRQSLRNIVSEADRTLQKIGNEALDIISRHGLNISEDFYRKSTTPVKVFQKMDSLKSLAASNSYKVLIDDVEKWYRKDNTTTKNQSILSAFNTGLNSLLKEADTLLHTNGQAYFTALAILENLNALGIVADVSLKMAQLCREKNIFLISGTNSLLSRIIDNNDTPFIYEKTGTRYSHFMIDEFQDTSSLQYLNFKPLINESLATKSTTLLVGDVKQAIYRWRNSDWNLLGSQVEQDFSGFGLTLKHLDTNWRSLAEVVNFNNQFFSNAPAILQNAFNLLIPDTFANETDLHDYKNKITNAYRDVIQRVPENKINTGGNIYVKFFEGNKQESDDEIYAKVVERIVFLANNGYKLSDICILVRKNKHGIMITNALLSGQFHPQNQSIPVISSESLLVGASEAIKYIVNHLKFLQNPNDRVIESFLRLTWQKYRGNNNHELFDVSGAFSNNINVEWKEQLDRIIKLQERPLYELTESLLHFLPEDIRREHSVYIQSFMSLLLGFINDETADLNAFLEYWDRNNEKFSLSIPEDQQAVKVMTIHKSKGLEFKCVILPFFSWDLISKNKNLLWISPLHEPFNQLPLVPVSLKKDLLNSYFAGDYLREIIQQYIDNLNLTYVAFTRARESLSVISSVDKSEKKSIQTIADLLLYYFSSHSNNSNWNNSELEYNANIKTGQSEKASKEKIRESDNITINELETTPFRGISNEKGKVKIHLESADYFHKDLVHERINYGKIMHQLFENIEVKADVEPALKAMRFKGRITKDEFFEIKDKAIKWLSHPKVENWFNGSYTVKTEAQILWHHQKRPDRVLINNNEIIVIDYKFGEQKTQAHLRQVSGYMNLLRDMGYQNVKGFIWYATLNDVQEVTGQQTLFD